MREIIVERDRAAGVVLTDGTAVRARTVIANVDPRTLLRDLVPAQAVPGRVKSHMKSSQIASHRGAKGPAAPLKAGSVRDFQSMLMGSHAGFREGGRSQ